MNGSSLVLLHSLFFHSRLIFIFIIFFTIFCDILSHFLLLHFCINPDPNDHKKDEAVDRLSGQGDWHVLSIV